ncbi:glycosyltransferase [Capnocytophaga canis]|uniref:glycosyltransferase n=1 Tax=Capnocytophaga canis TaxID=1848903 RepID=UPI0037D369EC
MQNKQIDIVIPFYNTANHIFELLRENITALLRENRLQNFSITLVNDGSTKDNYKSYIIALLSDFPHCVNFLIEFIIYFHILYFCPET